MPVASLITLAAVPEVHRLPPVLVKGWPGTGVAIELHWSAVNIPLTGQSPIPALVGMPPYQSPYAYQQPMIPAGLWASKQPFMSRATGGPASTGGTVGLDVQPIPAAARINGRALERTISIKARVVISS